MGVGARRILTRSARSITSSVTHLPPHYVPSSMFLHIMKFLQQIDLNTLMDSGTLGYAPCDRFQGAAPPLSSRRSKTRLPWRHHSVSPTAWRRLPLPFGFGRKRDSNRFEGEDEGEETGEPVNRTNRINYICPNCGMNAWGR